MHYLVYYTDLSNKDYSSMEPIGIFDDKEKAVMWCLLEKCFKSKRGLKRIINSVEDF